VTQNVGNLDVEEMILTEVSEACLTAKFVLKGRWREMEELLSKTAVDEFGKIDPDDILNDLWLTGIPQDEREER